MKVEERDEKETRERERERKKRVKSTHRTYLSTRPDTIFLLSSLQLAGCKFLSLSLTLSLSLKLWVCVCVCVSHHRVSVTQLKSPAASAHRTQHFLSHTQSRICSLSFLCFSRLPALCTLISSSSCISECVCVRSTLSQHTHKCIVYLSFTFIHSLYRYKSCWI